MPPPWLVVVSWTALVTAFGSVALTLADIYLARYQQRMKVMEAVWPITGLYLGPLAVWMYYRYGRPNTARWLAKHDRSQPPDEPGWFTTAGGVSHCGAGCTLGDIFAEFTVFALGFHILGWALLPEYIGDSLAALALGIMFYLHLSAQRWQQQVRAGLDPEVNASVERVATRSAHGSRGQLSTSRFTVTSLGNTVVRSAAGEEPVCTAA